jgi:hypothetical protein
MTLQDKILLELFRLEYRPENERSAKYVCMSRKNCDKFWVGKNGAVRQGRTWSEGFARKRKDFLALLQRIDRDELNLIVRALAKPSATVDDKAAPE